MGAYHASVSDAPDVADLATAHALIATLRDELTPTQREHAARRHQLDILCQARSIFERRRLAKEESHGLGWFVRSLVVLDQARASPPERLE